MALARQIQGMNKKSIIFIMLCSMLFCCKNHKNSDLEYITKIEHIIAPGIKGCATGSIVNGVYVSQANTDLEGLINWLKLSPVGHAAFPDASMEAMRDSLAHSLTKAGDRLSLIRGTYNFCIDLVDIMVQVEVDIEYLEYDNYKVFMRMLIIQSQ